MRRLPVQGIAANFKLPKFAVLVLAIWVAAFTSVGVVTLVLKIANQLPQKAIIVGALRLLGVFISGIGAASYIYVSSRATRPWQLHLHGVLMLLMLPENTGLMVEEAMIGEGLASPVLGAALGFGSWGVRRAIFFWLMTGKFEVLSSPHSCCTNIRPWGWAVISAGLAASFAAFLPLHLWIIFDGRGSVEETATLGASPAHLSPEEKLALRILTIAAFVGALLIVITSLAFMLVARHLIVTTWREMFQRQVTGQLLAAICSTFRQHLVGMFVNIITMNLLLLAGGIDFLGGLGQTVEDIIATSAHLIDAVGDVVGIMLLSGIGALLFYEDPEAGDLRGRLRSLLHCAVLSSRADTVFEGAVAKTPCNCCIVSFPGKYIPEWNALTWLCERGELSSACVFLPTTDPKQRFGQHVTPPETPGQCWCYSLYGDVKPWGCLWFEEWRSNVEEAVNLDLELVVVFFPNAVGKGLVRWENLGMSNLWDGVGLGGSQKAEVAYLNKRGYKYQQEDLEDTRAFRIHVEPTA